MLKRLKLKSKGREQVGYNIIDIINKFIDMEKNAFKMYRKIANMEGIVDRIKAVAKVLEKEEERHIQIYQNLSEELKNREICPIDFYTYDQISNLMAGFIYPDFHQVSDVKQLLEMALDFEKQSLALILRIQGLLVRQLDDIETVSYNALKILVEEEQKHIKALEAFL